MPVTRRKGEAALDAWSLVHAVSGMALGALGVGPLTTLGLLVAYEAAEAALRRKRSGWGVFEHESWPNIVADLCFGMAGFALAWAVRLQVGLGSFSP